MWSKDSPPPWGKVKVVRGRYPAMMYMIYIVAFIVLTMMARKGRRRMGRYLRGNVDENLGLGTLAASTLVSAIFDETVNERTYASSAVISWSLTNWTPAEGDGPIVVGLAHSDYTDAEVEEWIENTASWNEGALQQSREIGRRLIRSVGQFPIPASAAGGVVLNDGKPIKTKLGWILLQNQTLRYWAYNQGTSALATTSPDVRIQGHVNLFPK